VGNNPFESVKEKPAESIIDKKAELLKSWIESYNEGDGFFTFDDLHRKLACSKIFAEVYINELREDNFISPNSIWVGTSYYDGFSLTDKAKRYAIQQSWVIE
jgi:hypothetical protein